MNHPRAGFTLVELSIVIVILGLLIGGLMGGKAIIRSAELRSTVSDINKFSTAATTFKDKFGGLPGDFRSAVSVWGAAATPNATCRALTTASTDATTCDGNGDGQIDNIEAWRAWQQLAAAEMIEGSYSGVSAGANNTLVGSAGVNMPKAKINFLAGYVFSYIGAYTYGVGNTVLFSGDYGNALLFGTGTNLRSAVINGRDAWNIDKKMDDGLPGQGQMRGYTNTQQSTCATSDTATSATYPLTQGDAGTDCALVYIPRL